MSKSKKGKPSNNRRKRFPDFGRYLLKLNAHVSNSPRLLVFLKDLFDHE